MVRSQHQVRIKLHADDWADRISSLCTPFPFQKLHFHSELHCTLNALLQIQLTTIPNAGLPFPPTEEEKQQRSFLYTSGQSENCSACNKLLTYIETAVSAGFVVICHARPLPFHTACQNPAHFCSQQSSCRWFNPFSKLIKSNYGSHVCRRKNIHTHQFNFQMHFSTSSASHRHHQIL